MSTSTPPLASPATKLEGLRLQSGWVVSQRVLSRPGGTGGHFSVSYLVEKDGEKAFLKALDYSKAEEIAAQSGIDIPTALQYLVEAYNFERNLLRQCAERRMDRVVVALEDGSIRVEDGVFGTVNYLIFEPADGDVRTHLAFVARLEVAWILRCLHHIATGLYQLHSSSVAHQDLKPSNVLVFGRTQSKIADLGSASVKDMICPRDEHVFAGDSTYAPPELLYGHRDTQWSRRRQGCDVYHLGSMIVFFFCGVGMTAMILGHMPAEHHHRKWRGTYPEILPEVRDAFGLALKEFESQVPGENLKKALMEAVSQLCDPDPQYRGHPLNRAGASNQYSLERYVSLFNLLSQRAEIGILEGK